MITALGRLVADGGGLNMKRSWKLGRFLGIDVFMHFTFLLLIGWVLLSHWAAGESLEAAIEGVGFILALS